MSTTVLCTLNKCSQPISQLSSAESLSASDLFIVERVDEIQARHPIFQEQHQPYTEEQLIAGDVVDAILLEAGTSQTQVGSFLYNEMLGAVIEYIHSNGKISYSDLSTRLLLDLSAGFSFNTMSTRDTWEYSRAGHLHSQYSDVRVFSNYPTQESDSQKWLGNFIVWQLSSGMYTSSEISVYTPKIELQAFQNPDIGEVRFMGWPSVPTTTREDDPVHISVYNGVYLVKCSGTSGWWTYCNGAVVNCKADEFQDACEHFAGSRRATQFTLPKLNNFIKPNPSIHLSDPLELVPHENGLKNHSHAIKEPPENYKFSFKGLLTIITTKPGGNSGPYVHSGEGMPSGEALKQLSCYFDDNKSQKKTDMVMSSETGIAAMAGDDVETKPKCNKLLALVYLGEF